METRSQTATPEAGQPSLPPILSSHRRANSWQTVWDSEERRLMVSLELDQAEGLRRLVVRTVTQRRAVRTEGREEMGDRHEREVAAQRTDRLRIPRALAREAAKDVV